MITCIRRIQFSAGHRVYGHEGKCNNLHGHNYVVFFHARSRSEVLSQLDKLGRVIDFGVLKDRFGGWIETYWDHSFLHWEGDRELTSLFNSDERFITQRHFPCAFNPTAEEMARFLLNFGPTILHDTNVELYKVQVWETENCFAEASL